MTLSVVLYCAVNSIVVWVLLYNFIKSIVTMFVLFVFIILCKLLYVCIIYVCKSNRKIMSVLQISYVSIKYNT